jgi:hypothetical protein
MIFTDDGWVAGRDPERKDIYVFAYGLGELGRRSKLTYRLSCGTKGVLYGLRQDPLGASVGTGELVVPIL